MILLVLEAIRRPRNRFKPVRLNGPPAIDAFTVCALVNAAQRVFDLAKRQQATVQGYCDYIYGRPIGDYRGRCKVALVHMGLLNPEQTYVRPPYRSLWNDEKDRARDAVRKFGLENAGQV